MRKERDGECLVQGEREVGWKENKLKGRRRNRAGRRRHEGKMCIHRSNNGKEHWIREAFSLHISCHIFNRPSNERLEIS